MSFNRKEAATIGQFVQFAYDMFEAGGLHPPPPTGLGDAGFELVYHLNATDSLVPDKPDQKRFYGYIARGKKDPGNLILAIRGTRGPQEWLLDFLALPVAFTPAPDKGFVALGFLAIFNSFEFIDTARMTTTLSGAFTQLNAANTINAVTVAGHSLGSALATLATAELAFLNIAGVKNKLKLYPFASPRVGLLKFALSFNKAVPACVRIWNVLDIVPQLPPFPFFHVNGLGTPIIQTSTQLEQLAFTPRCEHILPDYLWLLGADGSVFDAKCLIELSPQVSDGVRALKKDLTVARLTASVFEAQDAPRAKSKKKAIKKTVKSRQKPKAK